MMSMNEDNKNILFKVAATLKIWYVIHLQNETGNSYHQFTYFNKNA